MSTATDPYGTRYDEPARYFLYRLNPLAKIAGPLPFIVSLLFVRDIATPLLFVMLVYAVLLIGSRLTARRALLLFVALPAVVLVLSVTLGAWVDAARVDDTEVLLQIGEYRFFAGSWLTGLATALRLAALVSLALVSGLTTTGPDLVRALVQQLRVPYRIGYTILAAYRFLPRFQYELGVIRAAHRVRGTVGGKGPLVALRRGSGYLVPLLASAIRHAERVALAMDSRAFGAHRIRTERHLVPWRVRDWVFVFVFWIAGSAGIVAAAALF